MKKIYKSLKSVGRFLFILSIGCCSGFTAFAQAQVGSGTQIASGYPLFISPASQYSITAAIYTAGELSAAGLSAGNISTIGWDYYTGGSNTSATLGGPMIIYMKHTSSSKFSGYPTFAAETTGATEVLNAPTVVDTVKGWMYVQLGTPFNWDGSSNLEVIVKFQNDSSVGTTWNSSCQGENLGTGSARSCSSAGISSFPTAFYSLWDVRANTRFNYDLLTVGVNNKAMTANSYTVYPNPATDLITVAATSQFSNARVKLMDLTGKVVLEQEAVRGKALRMDVSDKAPGLYMVEIAEGDLLKRIKLIIK